MHACCMRRPKGNQTVLTLLPAAKTFFTNLQTFVIYFSIVFLNLFFFFLLLPPLYTLPHFSVLAKWVEKNP